MGLGQSMQSLARVIVPGVYGLLCTILMLPGWCARDGFIHIHDARWCGAGAGACTVDVNMKTPFWVARYVTP